MYLIVKCNLKLHNAFTLYAVFPERYSVTSGLAFHFISFHFEAMNVPISNICTWYCKYYSNIMQICMNWLVLHEPSASGNICRALKKKRQYEFTRQQN